MNLLLTAMMPYNRLAMMVSISTGLRIDDVLALKTVRLGPRISVVERKTGKTRRVYIPARLLSYLQAYAGRVWVFPGRLQPDRHHRTRQAVWKDLRRVARLYRVDGQKIKAHVSPHSGRKMYAVREMHRTGSLSAVQRELRHSDPTVTALYAYADRMTDPERRWKRGKK